MLALNIKVLIICVIVGFLSGWYVSNLHYSTKIAKIDLANKDAVIASQNDAKKLQETSDKLAKISYENQRVRAKHAKELQNQADSYRSTCVDPEWLRLFNESATGEPIASGAD